MDLIVGFVGATNRFLGVTVGFLDLSIGLDLENAVRDLEECRTPQLYYYMYMYPSCSHNYSVVINTSNLLNFC